MKVSETMRHVSAQLKRVLERPAGQSAPSGAQAKKMIEDAITPLQHLFQRLPKSSEAAFAFAENTANDLFIFQLIVESLCRKGAFDSAALLLAELEETLPVTKEAQSLTIYKLYHPWSEELGLPMTDTLVRNSTACHEWKEVKRQGELCIAKGRKAAVCREEYLSVVYKLVKGYRQLDRSAQPPGGVEKELDKAIQFIRSRFVSEDGYLIYHRGSRSTALSMESKQFKTILSALSLLASSMRAADLERVVKQTQLPESVSAQMPLDLLYFVGKKMETININPYDNSAELVESAAPSVLSFHSSFFCPVLRSECTIDNYPSLLTCGHIISSRAVEKIASFRGAFFKCPYCPKEVHIRDIIRLKLPV